MAVSEGDQVVAESKSVNGSTRTGTVAKVLAEAPPRYLVRWENGGESIIAPAAGELRVVSTAPAGLRPARRGRPSDRGSGRRQP
jgi:Domain of unknown function (DUF1918)